MVKVTSVNPYYDDFNEDKKFYRILFKPAVAVQARELTQLQTILQNQISVMGNHIFENGTRVSGGELSLDNDVVYLKISGVYNGENIILSNFANKNIEGSTSGAIASVTQYIEAEEEDVDTLYVKVSNGKGFLPGENIFVQDTLYTTKILDENSVGFASICGLNEGYYYYDGTFIKCNKQQIILDKYSNTPTYKIGIAISDTIVNYSDDASLLDPANESTNYGAHGADRLVYNILLENRDISEDESISNAANFIELMRVENGVIVSETKYTQYSELDKYLARRTYDESGNFTVTPFDIKVENSTESDDEFDVYLGAGKAYVRGYEFETISSSKLTLNKARETQTTANYDINAQYGNYCIVSTIKGSFRPSEMQSVDLYDNSSKIGSANLRYIYNNDSNYSFYLFNISMNGNKSFNDVISIRKDQSIATLATGTTKLLGTTYNNLLFETPHTSVKTLKVDGISDTDYITQKTFDITFQAGVATISTSGNNTFYGAIGSISYNVKRQHYLVIINNVINAGSTGLSNGSVIGLENLDISISSGNQIATLNINDSSFQATATVICSVNLNYKPEKTKTLNTITLNKPFSNSKISLGYADIYKLISVEDSGSNDITHLFTLDNGQRDNIYDHGSITYIGEGEDDPTGNIKITFSYFEHSGSGYLSVDSYTSISYDEIPSYTMNNGVTVSLRDVLDFRPRRANNSSNFEFLSTGVDLPRPDSNINADYEFYLSRIDKIVLKEDRTFDSITGVPALTPTTPNDRDDAMTLYILTIPAYTFKMSDVSIKYVDNKRYTMRDIGKLDDRVSNLEYLATLSDLENSAKNRVTLDSTGENLFKSGILVDSFIGHNVGDLTNPDYNCSIDTTNRLLKPSIKTLSLPLKLVEDLSHNVVNNNGLLTPTYTESKYITQPVASTNISINPFGITSWIGNVHIEPATSTFIDTNKNPDIITNNNGINDGWNLNSRSPFDIHYNYWQTYWYGNQYNNEEDVMLNTDTANNIKKVLNNKIVNIDILPYVDELNVKFKIDSMKPNTVLHAFLDSLDIADYVYAYDGSAKLTQLVTDSLGHAEGSVVIPTGVIRTGTKLLRFIDDDLNNLDNEKITTMAEVSFYAAGLLNNRTDTMVSTIPTLIQRQELVEDYNLITSTPTRKTIAQSFVINNETNGVYINKLNLYFKYKSSKLPVSVELRPVVDGLPHPNKVVPYSQVTVNPADINVSETGQVPTTIKFDRPIFLIDGEYAVVIHTNAAEYRLYNAIIGDNILNSVTDSKVSRQLYVGSLYITGNTGVWEKESSQMLKFDIFRMNFDSGSYAILTCKYPSTEFEYQTFFAHIPGIIQSNCVFRTQYRNRQSSGILNPEWRDCEHNKNINLNSDYYLTTDSDSFMIRVDFLNSGQSTASIDLEKDNVVFVDNIINNSSSEEIRSKGGDAKAKYITKKVTLKEGFDASDLKVIFDAYKPNNTAIEVYYKVLNGEDSRLFDDRPYVKMTCDEDSIYSNSLTDIKEFTYYANQIQYDSYVGFQTFCIKIVFKSPSNSILPFVQNLKVLALV